jgi:hypothetical protein
MPDDIKEILNRLISSPQRSQIQIDFDANKKIFILSVPIFSTRFSLPSSVKEYVEARKNKIFKPHATSFHMEGEQTVRLIQEIPFHWGFQPSFREQIDHFWQLAKKCHRILSEIAVEEKYKAALYLDSDLKE